MCIAGKAEAEQYRFMGKKRSGSGTALQY